MPQPARLIVLPPSHYCERARWGLDHAGIAHDEVRWAVGPHLLLARRAGHGPALPVLATGSQLIQGSGRILDWTGLAGALPMVEGRFEHSIGKLVRQYLYAATLGDPRSGIPRVLFDGVPTWQAVAGRAMWPVTRRLMVSSLDARPARLPELAGALAAELDWFEAELGDRRHLVGDTLGRADITAASLLAPLARPAERPIYRQAVLPPTVATTLADWAERPALLWVRSLYAEHRHRRGVTSDPAA